MGTGSKTYLIAGGAILAGAVGAAVTGLDIKVVGIIVMAVGIIVFVVGAVGLVLKSARSAPRRRRTVTETGGARTLAAIAGQSTMTIDDVSGTRVL